MGAQEETPRVKGLSVSETGLRRRWTYAEKRRIVEESHVGGSTIADVARRYEFSRSILYDWRYRHRLGPLGGDVRFSLLIAVDSAAPLQANTLLLPQSLMAFDVFGRCQIMLPADFDIDVAARLIKGLMVRR